MATPAVSGLRRIGSLLRRSSVAAYWLDADRRLLLANPAWEALTGFAAEALIGQPFPPDAASTSSDDPAHHLARALAPPPEAMAGRDVSGPVLIVRPDGSRLWYRAEFWAWPDRGGRSTLGWLVRLRPSSADSLLPESPAQALQAQLAAVRARLRERHQAESLVGSGPAHTRLLEQIRTAVAAAGPTLIRGEPGTGKRTIARLIHRLGSPPDAPGPRSLDAAALSADQLERDLGIPPDPTQPLTWLILEPARLPRDVQRQLVARLERHGERLLATAADDPHESLINEQLVPELYFLLTAFSIGLLPLRERLDELPLLALATLESVQASQAGDGRALSGFEPRALEILRRYDWPGNLHELRRVVAHAAARAPGQIIHADDLPPDIQGHRGAAYLPPPLPPGQSLDQVLENVERRLLERALARGRHNKSRAADLLGISRPRLYRRMRELGLPDLPEPGATSTSSAPDSP
jgi:PAS domain S-box-containing protein